MYKVWRQAYINIDGTLRPAATISRSDISYLDCMSKLTSMELKKCKNKTIRELKYFGLQLFTTEDEANKEPLI